MFLVPHRVIQIASAQQSTTEAPISCDQEHMMPLQPPSVSAVATGPTKYDTKIICKQATLIIRHPDDGKLYVNFDQEILQLIREAKILDRMGIEIPESAKIALFQVTTRRGKTCLAHHGYDISTAGCCWLLLDALRPPDNVNLRW